MFTSVPPLSIIWTLLEQKWTENTICKWSKKRRKKGPEVLFAPPHVPEHLPNSVQCGAWTDNLTLLTPGPYNCILKKKDQGWNKIILKKHLIREGCPNPILGGYIWARFSVLPGRWDSRWELSLLGRTENLALLWPLRIGLGPPWIRLRWLDRIISLAIFMILWWYQASSVD